MRISPVLKMLGISVPEEALKQIEIIIPQIPARLSQAVEVVNSTIRQADERMSALEKCMISLEADNLALLEKFSGLAALLIEIKEQLDGRRIDGNIQRITAESTGADRNGASIAGTGSDSNRRKR